MKKCFVSCSVAALLFMQGCLFSKTIDEYQVDPWTMAVVITNQAISLSNSAEIIFNAWAANQGETDDVVKLKEKFKTIIESVRAGLQLAIDGIKIAQQAKEEPDIIKLLSQAQVAWNDLIAFLKALGIGGEKTLPTNLS